LAVIVQKHGAAVIAGEKTNKERRKANRVTAKGEVLDMSKRYRSLDGGTEIVHESSPILRKKMKKLIMSIAACVLLAPGFATAKETTFSGEIMDDACAKGGGHESMFKKMGTNDPKACTLACVKGGSKLVLFKADKTFYQLDNQKKPEPFAGQKVEVTGTLDKATKTIHVADIKAAS
jgi:hypothetical protein